MANVRVIALCKRCGVDGEHYTRNNGSKVSPCVSCAKAAAKAVVVSKADDFDYIDKRRAQYKKYNDSRKGRVRMAKAKRRKKPEGESDESEAAGRVALMMGGFRG